MRFPKATQLILPRFAKVLASAGVLFFLIYTLSQKSGFLENLMEILHLKSFRTISFGMLVLFMGVLLNWALESRKWQLLAHHVQKIPYRTAVSQSLTAHATALPTPARAGEYATKALFFPKQKTKKILFLNLAGNMTQMGATVLFGIFGTLWFCIVYAREFISFALVALLGILSTGILFYYFAKKKWQWFTDLSKKFKRILGLSILRYLVFSHQWFLALCLLGVDVPYPLVMSIIFMSYLGSSLLPVFQVLEVGLRGGVALLLFGWVGVPAEPVLASVSLIWCCNTILPGAVGSLLLLRIKKQGPTATPVFAPIQPA